MTTFQHPTPDLTHDEELVAVTVIDALGHAPVRAYTSHGVFVVMGTAGEGRGLTMLKALAAYIRAEKDRRQEAA